MKKEVQKSRSKVKVKKDLKLTIYLLLKKGKNPKEICDVLNLQMSALSYHLRRLKELGSIRKVGYGVWETLEWQQEKEVQKVKVGNPQTKSKNLNFSDKEIRGHAFRFKIKIPKLFNWENRGSFLDKKNIPYDIINKGYTHRIIFKGCKVWLNTSSIVVYFPEGLSFFGNKAKDTEDRAVSEMIEIMRGLDSMFSTSFKINKHYNIHVFGKHQSNIRNGLARLYNDNNRKLSVFNEDGQWLLIDDSFSLNELETVGCKGRNDATKDMDEVVKPFFNSLKERPFTAYDFEKLYDLTSKAVDNQDQYAENIKLHLEVMQDMRDTLKEIRKNIKNS